MGSKPITQRAGTKYGSPANQEKSVAKYATMTPVKLIDPDPTKPPKSVEEDVRDENSNNLLRGKASFSMGPDQVIVTPGETKYGWEGPLDTSGNYYEKLAKEEGFKNFQGTIKEYEQSKLKKMSETGEANVTQQQGESTTTTVPGESEVSFDYEPIIQNVDTEKLRESRERNRITRGSGRRAEQDANRVANLESKLDKLAKKAGTDRENIKDEEKSDRYKKLERKLNIKKQVAEASDARFKQNVEFSKAGVNPYNTRRTEQNKKASEDTQTKSEFESKFGSNNMGIQQIKSFTPGDITFFTPTIPTSTNTGANFQGAGSYLTQMANDNPKAPGTKRGYKMGGYGTKNK